MVAERYHKFVNQPVTWSVFCPWRVPIRALPPLPDWGDEPRIVRRAGGLCGGLSKLDRPCSVIDASFDELACFSLRQKQEPEPLELCQNNKVCPSLSKVTLCVRIAIFEKIENTLSNLFTQFENAIL